MSSDLQTNLHRHALALGSKVVAVVGSTSFVVWIAVAADVDYFAVLLLPPHVIS